MIQSHVNFYQDEKGRAALYSLIGIAGIFYYVQLGHQRIGEYYTGVPATPVFHIGVVLLLGVLTFFAAACSIHLRSVGGRSTSQMRKELTIQTDNIAKLLADSNDAMRNFEQEMIRQVGGISRKGAETLGLLKKIVDALHRRHIEARELLSTGRTIDVIDGYDLVTRSLRIKQNSMTSLIDSDPIAPIPAFEIPLTIEKLLTDLQRETSRKVA